MNVSCLASRSLDLDEVMPKTLEAIAALIPADRMIVIQRTEDTTEVRGDWVHPESSLRVDWTRIGGRIPGFDTREARCVVVEGTAPGDVGIPYLVGRSAMVCALLIPLVADGIVIGRLDILRTGTPLFTGQERQWAQACAKILALSVRNAVEYARVAWLAEHDPLTGIGNRRRFDAALGRETARAERYGRNLSLLLIDLDDFKEVNTHLGLSGGDEILRRTGAALANGARKGVDVPCRIGGDEFAMILPEIDEYAARELAQRLLREVAAATSSLWPVRFSYSVSTYPHIAAGLLRPVADSGLLDAKHRKEGLYREHCRTGSIQ
ncbi:MAG: GGDEF domain-containing protein [Acidiferrobacteraceae bacterium]